MESLPVEVIGNILSHLGAARDVVIASATCRKWREACRGHLHTLVFNSDDWPSYRDLDADQLEIIITQTIFQTKSLQCLSVLMDDVDEFSAAPVIAWLIYTRDTLRHFSCNVRITLDINILENCGRLKLESLALAHNCISWTEPSSQRFPFLKNISLKYVIISALDLTLLLNACPKIEVFELIRPHIVLSDVQATVELNSLTLKSLHLETVSLDKFILEADNLENISLKDLTLELFELVGKGTLKQLKIDDVSVMHLDVGESTSNLEIVDVSNFSFVWPKFYHMISKSTKLKLLRLWGVVFDDEEEILDFETVALHFPQLRQLSLSYDFRDGLPHYGVLGSIQMENVIVLELGWTKITEQFGQWVAGLLERCPNLKRLVVHGILSEVKSREECEMLANLTTLIVRLMKIYLHVEVQFVYE